MFNELGGEMWVFQRDENICIIVEYLYSPNWASKNSIILQVVPYFVTAFL